MLQVHRPSIFPLQLLSSTGDSGGPLIVHKRSRFIQVGVISWGVVDVCRDQRRQQLVPSYARDFHINLFQVLPWLKDKLKDEDLGFL